MKSFRIFISVLLIITGIVSIVFGVIELAENTGYSGSYATFGGDFYTYINRNAEKIADNTRDTNAILKKGFGFSLIVAGLTISLASLRSITNQNEVIVKNFPENHDSLDENKTAYVNTADFISPKNRFTGNAGIPENEFIVCPYCETKQRANRTICIECGKELKTEKSQESNPKPLKPVKVRADEEGSIQCPNCGTVQRGNRKICFKCGQPFEVE